MRNYSVLVAFKKMCVPEKLKAISKTVLPLLLVLVTKVVFADDMPDFDLSGVSDSISDHISSDVGKLAGISSILWLIVASIGGFNPKLLISVFALLLMIAFGPSIINGFIE